MICKGKKALYLLEVPWGRSKPIILNFVYATLEVDGSLLRASTKTNLLSFLRLLPKKKKKRNDKNILDNYKTLNRTTTNTKLTVACLKIQPGAIFSRQYIITYYVFLNELDVIFARKCHSVQKRKRKTAVVCFYVRS